MAAPRSVNKAPSVSLTGVVPSVLYLTRTVSTSASALAVQSRSICEVLMGVALRPVTDAGAVPSRVTSLTAAATLQLPEVSLAKTPKL